MPKPRQQTTNGRTSIADRASRNPKLNPHPKQKAKHSETLGELSNYRVLHHPSAENLETVRNQTSRPHLWSAQTFWDLGFRNHWEPSVRLLQPITPGAWPSTFTRSLQPPEARIQNRKKKCKGSFKNPFKRIESQPPTIQFSSHTLIRIDVEVAREHSGTFWALPEKPCQNSPEPNLKAVPPRTPGTYNRYSLKTSQQGFAVEPRVCPAVTQQLHHHASNCSSRFWCIQKRRSKFYQTRSQSIIIRHRPKHVWFWLISKTVLFCTLPESPPRKHSKTGCGSYVLDLQTCNVLIAGETPSLSPCNQEDKMKTWFSAACDFQRSHFHYLRGVSRHRASHTHRHTHHTVTHIYSSHTDTRTHTHIHTYSAQRALTGIHIMTSSRIFITHLNTKTYPPHTETYIPTCTHIWTYLDIHWLQVSVQVRFLFDFCAFV